MAPCGTAWKHAVLNHVWLPGAGDPAKPWGALALGSHVISGREPDELEPSRPAPAGSTLEVVTVNGDPEENEVMPETRHPLRAPATTPWLPLKSTRLNSSHL